VPLRFFSCLPLIFCVSVVPCFFVLVSLLVYVYPPTTGAHGSISQSLPSLLECTWQSPVLDHFWRAGHSMEIPFVFNNAELGEQSTGGGKAVLVLTDKVSQAWINFAKTGNPNHKGLPNWPAFTRENGATMIFDDPCEVRSNHDKVLVSLLAPE
jgi:carboxylesterase type B